MTQTAVLFSQHIRITNLKKYSQPTGFEPVRGDPIGFRVQRLNHSATTAAVVRDQFSAGQLSVSALDILGHLTLEII